MSIRGWNRYTVTILCLFLLAGLGGCATGSSGRSHSRGSLSDAAAEAADNEEEAGRGRGQSRSKDERGSDYYEDHYEDDSDDGGNFFIGLVTSLFSGGGGEPAEEPAPHPTDYRETGSRTWTGNGEVGAGDDKGSGGGMKIERSNFNFWYSRSRMAGDTIQRFNQYTFMFSWYTGPRYRAHAGLYYGEGKPGPQVNVKEGFRWISEAGIDVGTRGYLTPKHSLMGFYVIAGLRLGVMYWSYTNPLDSRDEEGNPELISHDGLGVFVPYVGLGTSLLQTKAVHIGASATIGGRLPVNKTFREYDNDLFKPVGEYKLNIEASIFF